MLRSALPRSSTNPSALVCIVTAPPWKERSPGRSSRHTCIACGKAEACKLGQALSLQQEGAAGKAAAARRQWRDRGTCRPLFTSVLALPPS